MQQRQDRWNKLIRILESMEEQLKLLNGSAGSQVSTFSPHPDSVYVPFKGAEIYLLLKAFIDAGGAPYENYKTILEKIVPFILNRTHKKFSIPSLIKYSDKVDFETKDTVKRFLQKMVRNIDSYD